MSSTFGKWNPSGMTPMIVAGSPLMTASWPTIPVFPPSLSSQIRWLTIATRGAPDSSSTGVLWRLWREGLVDPLVDEADVEACLDDGPQDNRGWARGQLIRRFRDEITDVDWSYVELRRSADRWGPRLRVTMPRPSSLSRARFESILQRAQDPCHLAALLREQSEELAEDSNPMRDIRSQLALGPENS